MSIMPTSSCIDGINRSSIIFVVRHHHLHISLLIVIYHHRDESSCLQGLVAELAKPIRDMASVERDAKYCMELLQSMDDDTAQHYAWDFMESHMNS